MATMIKGKSPEEIERILTLEDQFTPEQEEQVCHFIRFRYLFPSPLPIFPPRSLPLALHLAVADVSCIWFKFMWALVLPQMSFHLCSTMNEARHARAISGVISFRLLWYLRRDLVVTNWTISSLIQKVVDCFASGEEELIVALSKCLSFQKVSNSFLGNFFRNDCNRYE